MPVKCQPAAEAGGAGAQFGHAVVMPMGGQMDAETLKNLINSDPEALSLAAADSWKDCAARCAEIAPPLRVPIAAQTVLRFSCLDGSFGRITLATRDSSEHSDTVKCACLAFLKWLEHEWPLDVDLPQVQGMLAILQASGIVTAESAAGLASLANTPRSFTPLECRIAVKGE